MFIVLEAGRYDNVLSFYIFIRERRHGMPVNVPLDHVFLSFVGEEKSFVPTELRCFSERFYYIVSEVKGLSSLQVWAEPTKISHPLSKLCLLLTPSSV